MKEYAIWGIPPQKKHEDLLLTEIKSIEEAKKQMRVLEVRYGCTELRIQTIDLFNGFNEDFIKSINL